jgi:calcineurin-like phosphoesterase family protein
MYFFTGDEHFFHKNIIRFCNRPYLSVEEMNEAIIQNHNEIVSDNDITIHLGDFTLLKNSPEIFKIIKRLNGKHTFIQGSHDRWLQDKRYQQIWEKKIDEYYVVCCHYAMRVWPRSHYNSWQLYGHSHGNLEPVGKQWDVGVDNNNFYPVSFDSLVEIMKNRPDNFNLVKKK